MNHFSYACSFLVVALGVASAQVISFGKCPTVTVKRDFNPLQYLGIWYEIRRYPAAFESGQKCSRAEYSAKPSGSIKVNNTATDSKQQSVQAVGEAKIPGASVPAKLRVTFGCKSGGNAGITALLSFLGRHPTQQASPVPAPYWVVDTDYTNYAIVYSCTQIAFAKTAATSITSVDWLSRETGARRAACGRLPHVVRHKKTRNCFLWRFEDEFAWILSRTPTLNGALEPGIADTLARNNISAKPFSNTLQQVQTGSSCGSS